MKPVRWSAHALKNLRDREIDREEATWTLTNPEFTAIDRPLRSVYMRRYYDRVLQQPMLLRLIVEDSPNETVVVTVYKTSQFTKYLKGYVP